MATQEDKKKNVEILIRAVIVGQGKGIYSLKDASLLYTAVQSLTTEKKEFEESNAIDALVQGALLGQKGGAFSLEDANTVFNAVKWFESQQQKKPLEKIVEVEEPSSSSD
jgi:hypothetical protein